MTHFPVKGDACTTRPFTVISDRAIIKETIKQTVVGWLAMVGLLVGIVLNCINILKVIW